LLRDAVEAQPGEAFLHQMRGEFLVSAAPPRWAEAVECFASARALRPETGLSLANALSRAGRLEEALSLASRLAKAWPRDLHARLLRAEVLLRARSPEALAAYREALEFAPGHPVALSNLALVHLRRGEAARAADLCRRAIAAEPGLAAAHGNLASALLQSGKPRDALASAEAALDLVDAAAFHYVRGLALFDLRRYADSATAFRSATLRDPSDFRSFGNLGVALGATGDRTGSIQAYRKAVAIEPGYALGHANLGNLLMEAGKHEEALPPLRRAIELSPGLWNAHAALGRALLRLGKRREAAAHSREGLRLMPPGHPARPSVQKDLEAAEK
ncbi:MAG: tetratricopeptide repeat protein, partial [Gemmataceae bacterium]|nr:tetratricopeptide repeat protein [Gemmataceae bacterium]